MADTGAPWNIPYIEATDLVRDYPTDSEALADAIADGLTAAGNAGIGSNVVQTVKTDTFTTSSGTYTTVTGLAVSFTPTSASSNVLVICSVGIANSSGSTPKASVSLFRDGSNLVVPTSPSDRTPAYGSLSMPDPSGEMDRVIWPYHFTFLDSPETASAVTYDVRVRATGTAYVNRADDDNDTDNRFRGVSTITAIEVKA